MTYTTCACPTNEAGDIRCHNCGERVNRRCWLCKTPRGEGPCPTPPETARQEIDESLKRAYVTAMTLNAQGGHVEIHLGEEVVAYLKSLCKIPNGPYFLGRTTYAGIPVVVKTGAVSQRHVSIHYVVGIVG